MTDAAKATRDISSSSSIRHHRHADQITAIAVEPAGVPTLFTNLGGLTAISAVVDEFLGVVVADSRINKFFAQTVASPQRVASLRQNLIDQVCAGSGGPCQYKGGDIKSVHRGMALTDVEFDALVVPLPEKAALIGVLAPVLAPARRHRGEEADANSGWPVNALTTLADKPARSANFVWRAIFLALRENVKRYPY